MNKFILKTMRYVDNPYLFTAEEMMENADAAYAAAYYATNASGLAAELVARAAAVSSEATARTAADYANSSSTYTDYAIDKYFKITGENKQDYIDEVERLR